jgi:hypothetical protein
MKIDFKSIPALALLLSLFTDANKVRVSKITDEIRRLFLYGLSHWYVLLSLMMMSIPLIIMSAGKDIAYGLFDNQQGSFWSSFFFILEFCWVLLVYAMICWRLPLHYVADKYIADITESEIIGHTDKLNFRDPLRQKVYRFNGFVAFALMIAWILSFAKVKLSILDIAGIIVYVVSLWKASQFFAKHLEGRRQVWTNIEVTDKTSFYKLLRFQKPLLAAFIPCVALGLVFLAIAVGLSYKRDDVANYFVLAGSLGFTAVIFYVLADYVDRVAIEKRPIEHLNDALRNDAGLIEKALKRVLQALTKPSRWFVYLFVSHDIKTDLELKSWKKPFLYIHVFCFIHVLLATLFFCLVPNMQAIHPVFCILYGVSFVVFVLDWLNYIFYRDYYIFARWTIIAFALLFAAMFGCFAWALMTDQTVSYVSGGANLMLLFLCIKWLRHPNVDNYTQLKDGEVIDKSVLSTDDLAAIEREKAIEMQAFVGESLTSKKRLLNSLNASPNSWLGKPIHVFGTRELSVFGIGITALLLINLMMPNAATHDLALLNSRNEKPNMPHLKQPKAYIMGWLDNRQKILGKDSFDVYIVSGQGGGSRGAYWFSKIMTEMDAITEGSFRQQCLAMSTVSGSSVGAQGIVALWDSIPFSKANNDLILSKFSHNAFQHNFLSGNLADLFFKDNMAAFWPSTGDFNPLTLGRGDRNHRLQHEEAVRINDALEGGPQQVDGFANWSILKAFKLDALKNCSTNEPFWSFYYNDFNSDKPRYKVPLLFANSCQVQEGKRCFVSPVQNDSTLFVNTFDLTNVLIKHSKSISLTSAANLSELFPYLSMASHLPINRRLEYNFVDGGYYENYGLTTAYELIRFCADSLKTLPQYKGIRLHLIAINNSQDAVADNTIKGISQITAPVQAIMGATFGGHADHKLKEIRANSKKGDFNFYEIKMPYTDDKSIVPLSRMLSIKSMRYMDRMVADSMRKISPMRELAAGERLGLKR